VHGLAALLTVLGIGSALLGAALALVQDDLKRLLAWDTVSQTGLLVAGFVSRTDEGVAGAVYHLVNHALFKTLLFLCAGAIVHSTGLTTLLQLGGLTRRRPLLTVAFVVGSAAIAGVPPLNGYASVGLVHDGLVHEPAAYAGALVAQALTVAALARAAYLGFLRKRAEPYEHLERSQAGMRISLILLAAGCIGFGVGAATFVPQVAAPAASVLLHPATYASAVLGSGGTVPAMDLAFDYTKVSTMATAAAELLVGLALAAYVVRRGEPRVLTPLRRLHTGSVNDYAAYAAVGAAIAAYTLLA
jgi:multicomponent Na+:H+ antiporter subunit D